MTHQEQLSAAFPNLIWLKQKPETNPRYINYGKEIYHTEFPPCFWLQFELLPNGKVTGRLSVDSWTVIESDEKASLKEAIKSIKDEWTNLKYYMSDDA